MRGKADSTPTENATSNASVSTASSSTSKGLLSFNTSNFTKLFKNSTNFVQSTFGSVSAAPSQPQSTSYNSSTEITEQSFTIPSIKKRHDASNPAAPKKQRDILSTPVLIQPVSMTNSSPLANLSSYKKLANDDGNNVQPKAYSPIANGSQKVHKPSMPAATSVVPPNVTVTISPVSNQKSSFLSHARNSLSNPLTALATKPNDTQQTINDAKLQNPQTVADNHRSATLSPATAAAAVRSPAAKKSSNANILFETVKMCKQTGGSTSTPSTSKVQSSSISSDDLNGYNKNVSIPSGNHLKNVVTKNDMVKKINNDNNEHSVHEKPSSIQNVMDNELIDVRYSQRNRDSANTQNVTLSNNRMKDISMNGAAVISSPSKPFSTSNMAESTNSSNNMLSNVASTQKFHHHHTINDNGMAGTQAKNNNLLPIDVLNNDDVDIPSNAICNNNLDYNLDECLRQISNTNNMTENPFKLTTANQFSAANFMSSAAESPKTAENIYANCVMMPRKSANLDNYQQQDTNENVIGVDEMDALEVYEAADSPNNNYSENFMGTDSSNICNNNAPDELDQLDISNVESATSKTTTQTTSFANTNTTNDSPNKTTSNITLSSFSQNCFAPKSNELYDILEESDDDERTNLFRFNRWNSSCSLFVPKTSVTSFSSGSGSLAAAIAFANEMNSTNRNPFLQLISVSPTNTETQMITTTSTESPIVAATCTQSELFGERQKNSIGIAAPLISSAFNNNDQTDVCMAFTSTDKCLTSSALSISNCANAWNEFALQAQPPPPPMPPPSSSSASFLLPHESQSSSLQTNGFIEQNDFQLNAISNSMAKNRISSDVMDAMLLFLKENGNQYIKQFMQVIYGE